MSQSIADRRAQRGQPAELEVVPRDDFLRAFGHDYAPGQHLTMIGPTQRGKTTLCLQLLREVISPEHKCVILAGKPPGRDKVMAQAAKDLNLRIISEWPPDWSPRDRKRNGYVLRPKHSREPEETDRNLRNHYREAILDNYNSSPKKPVITVVDETAHVQYDLKLKKEVEAPLMRGAPVNAVWSLVQRGRYISYHVYDAPEHIFIFHDPDRSNQERYSEIGGVDPKWMQYELEGLQGVRTKTGQTVSQCLYIRRSGPELCIVDVS